MKRSLALPLGVVLLAVLVVLITGVLTRPPTGVSPADAGGPGPAPEAEAPVSTIAELAPSDLEVEREAAEIVEDDPPVEVEARPRGGRITVRGTIVVLDADDVEHPSESGSFTPVRWKGNTGRHGSPVEIVGGCFELSMLPDRRLGVDDLKLGDRWARLVDDESIAVAEGEVVELRAVWPRTTILRVVDAEFHADLPDVEVVLCSSWRFDDNPHPGDYSPEDVLFAGAHSPIEINPGDDEFGMRSGRAVLWARSPGYTWGRVQIDFDLGGERVLTLEAAAELEVSILNLDQGPPTPGAPVMQPVLRLRPHSRAEADPQPSLGGTEGTSVAVLAEEAGLDQEELEALLRRAREEPPLRGRPLLEELPEVDGPTLLTGLVPGEVSVSVEVGDWWEDTRLLLGWTTVVLEAGRRARVTLELEDLPVFEAPVPLAGTLFLPPAWGEAGLGFRLEPMDLPDVDYKDHIRIRRSSLEPVAGHEGLYRWSAGDVIPGRFEASFSELELQHVFHVPVGGLLNAHIEIGEPADVLVHILDGVTGEPIPLDNVNWTCERPTLLSGGSLGSAPPDEESGGFRFRAPAGRVQLHLWEDGYEFCNELHEVRPGTNEITVHLVRSCGLAISAQEDGKPLPYDLIEDHIQIEEVDGQGRGRSWGYRGDTTRIGLTNPGLYEIRLEPLDGYQPVEPQHVQVPPGEFIEHVVVLHRIP